MFSWWIENQNKMQQLKWKSETEVVILITSSGSLWLIPKEYCKNISQASVFLLFWKLSENVADCFWSRPIQLPHALLGRPAETDLCAQQPFFLLKNEKYYTNTNNNKKRLIMAQKW